jgi:hypothetical protein
MALGAVLRVVKDGQSMLITLKPEARAVVTEQQYHYAHNIMSRYTPMEKVLVRKSGVKAFSPE